jgi:hypothetical protein
MVWNKCNPFGEHRGSRNHLFSNECRRAVSTRASDSRSRCSGGNRRYTQYLYQFYYYLAFCVLAVTPLRAEEPKVQNTSNPVAAATGNVTNQAVQFQNTGAPSRQYFAGNNSCNGSTMTVSPFVMGNDTKPYQDEGYVVNYNWGMQLNFSVPLDGGMVETCKQIAKRHEQKMRLDYELVRALKCTEIMKAGFTFRPGSRVEVLCHDIVPIVALNEKESN